MPQLIPIIIFLLSAALLIRSGSIIVGRLSRIARFFEMSEFAASFILIAFATSLPDLFVGVSAALHGEPELSFSNVLGANIVMLTLAAGVAIILARGLEVKSDIMRRDSLYAAFAVFLPILLFLDGVISRVDGVLLIIFAVWYGGGVVYQRERFTKIFSDENKKPLMDLNKFTKDFAVLAVALVFLILSAEGMIRSSLAIASGFGIPISIIGIILVALSVTLPEIVFSARAILMNHKSMVLGNLMGSVVVNSGIVIGVTAIIAPISVPSFTPYTIAIAFSLLAAFMFTVFAHTNKKLSVNEGILLIVIYALFVFLVVIFSGKDII